MLGAYFEKNNAEKISELFLQLGDASIAYLMSHVDFWNKKDISNLMELHKKMMIDYENATSEEDYEKIYDKLIFYNEIIANNTSRKL